MPTPSKRQVKPGGSFADHHPELVPDWDFTKNFFNPEDISYGNQERVWWKCSTCSYEWFTAILARHQGKRCPACAGTVAVPGKTGLLAVDPAYADWWDESGIDPDTILPQSGKVVHWLCPRGHEFTQKVRNFSFSCSRCPSRSVASVAPAVALEWSPKNKMTAEEVSYNSAQLVWWDCGTCSHSWSTAAYQRVNQPTGCPRCVRGVKNSAGEAELAAFFLSAGLEEGVDFIRNDRLFLSGTELDFFFPSRQVAVEFNGLYWHSEEAGRGREYHQEKWEACRSRQVQLLQIWSDEWVRNPEQVKRMLAHKLNLQLTEQQTVMARKTSACLVDKKTAEEFLQMNHIQGFASGSYYLGLRDKEGLLVALLVMKKEPGSDGQVLNIVRYATSMVVPGGFTKLMKHAERVYKPRAFITFSDHCVSDGSLYRNNGFVVDGEVPPDYRYLVRKERVHKFNYRLKRFREDPELVWEDGLSERDLARLNNIPRIWDAGKTRWRKEVSGLA